MRLWTKRVIEGRSGRPRLFYGWWIALAGALAHAVSSGFSFFGLSAFFPALEQEFGWSRTAISGAFSLARVESGLLGPLEGFFTDKLGVRKMMLLGVALSAAGFFLFSQVNSLVMLYVVFVLGIVMGSSLGFYVPVSAAIANWFHRKRSMAFGLFRTGPGLGGLMVPLVGWLVVTVGWRETALIAGGVILVLGLPLALVMRHRPEDYGYLPDGEVPPEALESRTERPVAQTLRKLTEADFTILQALRTSAFWLISAALTLRQLVTTGVTVHFVIMLVDRGIDARLASFLLGSLALMSIPGRVGLAWLGDYFNKRLLMAIALGVLGLSVFLMGRVVDLTLFIPVMLTFAFFFGGLASLQEPLRADYFGRRYFASIQGFTRMIQTVGLFLGPVSAGFLYDLTQSYTLSFSLFSGAAFLGMLCILAARPPQLEAEGAS